jgi:transcription elongation factor Elf1
MDDNKIICPYCGEENEALDYEDCDIDWTTMKCKSCDKEFEMSRTIEIHYSTWRREQER